MIPRIKFDPQQAAREFAEFQRKFFARFRVAVEGQGPRRPDRQHTEDPRLSDRQDHAASLQGDREDHDQDTSAGYLRSGRPLHDGRSAGRPFAGSAICWRRVLTSMSSTGATRVAATAGSTLDDYIDGYLNECVDFIRSSRGIDRVTLLGICEGGVVIARVRGALSGEGRESDPDYHAG